MVRKLVAEEQSGGTFSPHPDDTADPASLESQHDPAVPHLGQDGGSDDELDSEDDDSDDGHSSSNLGGGSSIGGLEDRFHDLEEEVATLVADVHDLALFTKLNITGFMKILKVCLLSVRLREIILMTYYRHRNTTN